LRNDFNDVVQEIKRLQIFKSMHLTTNATHFIAHQNSDNALLWSSVNVSLDSLDAANFARITGRDEWHAVMKNLKTLLSFGAHVRVNVVVMNGKNDHEILPFVQWAMTEKIDIRFIEEMPFNGHQKKEQPFWTADRIVDHIRTQFAIEPMPDVFGETARYYKAADMLGRVGVIAAYSRSFCGSCNRIRITPLGVMRTCLYSEGGLQLRDALRNGCTDDQIINAIKTAVNGKAKNGWEAERLRETNATESMAIIGG
jgi:cyclic pyranopterin phosphate synthase